MLSLVTRHLFSVKNKGSLRCYHPFNNLQYRTNFRKSFIQHLKDEYDHARKVLSGQHQPKQSSLAKMGETGTDTLFVLTICGLIIGKAALISPELTVAIQLCNRACIYKGKHDQIRAYKSLCKLGVDVEDWSETSSFAADLFSSIDIDNYIDSNASARKLMDHYESITQDRGVKHGRVMATLLVGSVYGGKASKFTTVECPRSKAWSLFDMVCADHIRAKLPPKT